MTRDTSSTVDLKVGLWNGLPAIAEFSQILSKFSDDFHTK